MSFDEHMMTVYWAPLKKHVCPQTEHLHIIIHTLTWLITPVVKASLMTVSGTDGFLLILNDRIVVLV